MDKSVHLPRDVNSSRLKTEDVVKLVRPSDRIRAQVPVPTTYVGQALRLGQLRLALLELLLGLFSLSLGTFAFDGSGENFSDEAQPRYHRFRPVVVRAY